MPKYLSRDTFVDGVGGAIKYTPSGRRLEVSLGGGGMEISGESVDLGMLADTFDEWGIKFTPRPSGRGWLSLSVPYALNVQSRPNPKRKKGKRRRENPDDRELLSRLIYTIDKDPRSTRGWKGKWITVYSVDPLRERSGFKYYGDWRDGEVPFDLGSVIGEFTFKLGRTIAHANRIDVSPDYSRRGVASALYRWVEHRWWVRVKHSSDQTDDGKAFARGLRRNPSLIVMRANPKKRRKRRGNPD